MQVTNPQSDPVTVLPDDDYIDTDKNVLDGIRREVDAFVADQYNDFLQSVVADVFRPVATMASGLADKHRSILQELATSVDENIDHWRKQRNYRERVETEVIEPLQSFLKEESPSISLGNIYFSLLNRLESLVSKVPETVTIAEPDDLYQPDSYDSTGIVLRKMWIRLGRTVGRVFGSKNRGVRQIDVPVRGIVTYHVKRRVPAAASQSFRTLHEELGYYTGRLETAISDWFSGVIKADRVLDLHTIQDSGEAGDDAESDSMVLDRVEDAAEALQDVLDACSELLLPASVSDDATLAFAWQMFELDLDGCGTFLSTSPVPDAFLGDPTVVGRAADVAAEWTQWHEQVCDRLIMINALIDLRDEMLALEHKLSDKIEASTLVPFEKSFAKLSRKLESAHETAKEESAAIRHDRDLKRFTETLKSIRLEVLKTSKSVASMPGLITGDSILDKPGLEEWEELKTFCQNLPESLRIHPALHIADPRAGSRTVRMRESVISALHMSLPDRLTGKARPLKQHLVRAWSLSENIDSIVIFNIDAAVEEIDDYLSAGDPESQEETEHRTIDQIRQATFELAGEGLRRADETIDDTISALRSELDKLDDEVNREFLNDWTVIHRTVRTSDDTAEQWAEVLSRSRQRWALIRFHVEKWWKTGSTQARQWLRLGERSARGLIRKGQTAVGVLEHSDTRRAETVEALSKVASFKKELPIVYRRLFSFEELETADLAEARSRDLVWVRTFTSGWKDRRNGGVAIISGDPGSGKSSFLNILSETSLKGLPVTQIRFSDRPDSEQALVEHLAGVLETGRDTTTLEELEVAVNAMKELRCVLIDDAEHLFMQVGGGKDLFERFMLFLSRSDRFVCWIVMIGKPAWKYLSRTAQRITGFAASYELTTIDRAGYEALVVNRHRRSGMPLVFEQPRDRANQLRERLSRNKTDAEIQTALRESYFEALRKASGQNVMLALLYWIRSVKFSEDGALHVYPLKPLSFDFLSAYDTGLAFTLRSVIVHKTLSVDEHNRVFGISDDETAFILERLVNDRMIYKAGTSVDSTATDQPDRYDGDLRFRVHPLAQAPIVALLTRNNLLH